MTMLNRTIVARPLAFATLVFSILTATPSAFTRASDWPQWRGPDRTDISTETGLLKSWPEGGPKQVWVFKNAGSGYSGPAIVSGKLFTMGTRDEQECIIALDANNGKELWVRPLGRVYREGHGDGPRATPTVDGNRVYTMSGQGDLACVLAEDGNVVWKKSMNDLGGQRPGWGYTESVLIDGNRLICTPGGNKGTVAALDKEYGSVVWQTGDLMDQPHYSSPILVTHKGVRQYVKLTASSLVGISPEDGKILWKVAWPGRTAVIPTPIYHDGNVFVTSGYGVGCMLVKIADDSKSAEMVYNNRLIVNHHGGVVQVDGRIYGHSDSGGWTCLDMKTGEKLWQSRTLGKGAVGFADGMLYCLEESSGTVALVEANPKEWTEKSRFKLEPQSNIRSSQGRVWTHPVISNGKLYLRDQDLIYCYDIKG